MSSFLEQYGIAIFTLVLIAILIAFAGPLGMKIKEYTLEKAEQTEQIGKDEITVATGGTVRPAEPIVAVDKVYCIYYADGEMTISQNEIEPEAGRTVVKKGFYEKPSDCTSEMTTVRFVGIVKPKSCTEWFNLCKPLVEIKNIENLNTNECTDMSYMFCGCLFLKNIDVSGFNTNKVTDMSGMFFGCQSFTSINIDNFDTSNVTSMKEMFRECMNINTFNFKHFDTSKVTDMSNMFTDCEKLTNLDLSIFDTKNVVNMSWMFASCESLTSINIDSWNTEKCIEMGSMFSHCKSLTNLNLSHFNTTSVKSINQMFSYCESLTDLNLSGWNINKKIDANYMFTNCVSLHTKSVKVSQTTYNELITISTIRITADKFDII